MSKPSPLVTVIIPPSGDSLPLPQILRGRWGSPDVIRWRTPDLGHLGMIPMPWPWFKITKRFIQHLVELGKHLNDLVIGIAMISVDIMTWPVAPWPLYG